jgi:orotate phosphoribosyltransferase
MNDAAQLAYLELLLSSGVLRFGEFKTKSGRLSPYFFNLGAIASGQRMAALAECYATRIAARFPDVENLYGPAYKGIPLAVSISTALAAKLKRDVTFTFNRKEAKDHGEGGLLVGYQYQGGEKVVIVEDVITGGTSIGESLPVLQRARVNILGICVGIDREERGLDGDDTAVAEVQRRYGLPVAALTTLTDVVTTLSAKDVLGKRWLDAKTLDKIAAYRHAYGAKT